MSEILILRVWPPAGSLLMTEVPAPCVRVK